MPANTVKVDRSTKWGNPFQVGQPFCRTADDAVRMFKGRLPSHPLYVPALPDTYFGRLVASIPDLRGKNLACWCPLDAPCHADVLLELANRDESIRW
jgi:hypothetical protein